VRRCCYADAFAFGVVEFAESADRRGDWLEPVAELGLSYGREYQEMVRCIQQNGSKAVQHADSLEWNFGLARAGTRTRHNAFSLKEMMERPMNRAILLTGTAVLLGVLAKRGRRIRAENSDHYMNRTSFKVLEMTANNLKTATKKVDDSAARVEVALKKMLAAA
jgi:hypothetical protein